MKIKILNKTDNELKIEISGAGHELCNLLQQKILEDEKVDLAGYDVPHPLASSPVIYVRAKGRVKPEDILIRAAKKAIENNDTFGTELAKALKE